MKKIFWIALIVLCVGVMLITLTACSGNGKTEDNTSASAIVGKWVYESSDDMYYTFEEGGTGSYFFVGGEMKFTYEDDGEKVTIKYEGTTEPNVFKYTIDNNVLKIEDSFGDLVTYIKK